MATFILKTIGTISEEHRNNHFCVTDCVTKACKILKATFVVFVKLLTHFWDHSKIKEPSKSSLDHGMCVDTKRRVLWSSLAKMSTFSPLQGRSQLMAPWSHLHIVILFLVNVSQVIFTSAPFSHSRSLFTS